MQTGYDLPAGELGCENQSNLGGIFICQPSRKKELIVKKNGAD